jgi:trypsin-like peptidase
MGIALWVVFLTIFAILSVSADAPVSGAARTSDDSLLIYAIKVIHGRPLQKNFSGYGIYLGKGAVITAAHVMGRWPAFIANPRVVVAGRELPARIVKKGSPETIDLALLLVDERELPVSLRLRRNPLCKETARSGDDVIVASLQKTARSQIELPQAIPPEFRRDFNTFIRDEDVGASGSGVFNAEKKCLLGIITTRTSVLEFEGAKQHTIDFKHFVPAATIAKFIPPEFRF